MEIRVLGPVEVRDHDHALRLGGFRQRLVLAVLLLQPDRAVTTDWLVDAVWGEAPPRTARKTLQVYVSRLRGLLGADAVEATDAGYVLRVDPDDLDSRRFERLADEGHRLLATDPSSAAGVLRRALSLWRGMPWGELGEAPALRPEAERLLERRLDALADRITADVETGHAARVIGELEGLVEEHPWREGFRAQLMLALYRAGRQSDALQVYQATRRLLGDELGIEPSDELRELDAKIVRHDPSLAAPTEVELQDWVTARNPYKGLRPFRYEDRADFFGRARLVDELVEQVQHRRFVAVVGASGSGKSSAVLAGLITRLPADRWVVATMVPGRDPRAAAQTALDALQPRGASALPAPRCDGLDLVRAAQAVSPDDGRRLLLVIDQLEELFHHVTDDAARRRFVRDLVELVEDPAAPVTVLVVLRASYLDRALQLPGLGEQVSAAMVGVRPLEATELEAAARRPAERVGARMEPELIAELVGDMVDQPGALPLFQYVLTELFEERTGPVLGRAAYQRLGGLGGALIRRAEDTYGALDSDGRAIAHQVFMRLVTVDASMAASRRRVDRTSLESLDPTGQRVDAVLDAFDAARLLTFDRNPVTGEATVEVAHEALLAEWPRMCAWVDAARDDLRLHGALVAAVDEWERSGRRPDYLLTGSRLDVYEGWSPTTGLELTEPEAAFVSASTSRRTEERAREEERRATALRLERRSVRRLRALVVVVSVAALVAAGLTVFAVDRSREAAASERETRARGLANASRISLETDSELAILLALEAIDVTQTADGVVLREAEEALHAALHAHRLFATAPGAYDVAVLPDGRVLSGGDRARLWDPATGDQLELRSQRIMSVASSPDGSLLATGGESGSLALWDATTAEQVRTFTRNGRPAHDRFIRDVVFSSDGSLLASASGDLSVRVWDVATGEEVRSVERPDGAMWDVLGDTPQLAFHPDGTRLAITGFRDEAARILDIATGEWASSLPSPDVPARAVQYVDRGSRLVTAATYDSIGVWDGATESLLFSVPMEQENLRLAYVAVSPDGSKLAITSDDAAIRLFELGVTAARPTTTLIAPRFVAGIDFGPDGNTLASATEHQVQLWSVASGGRGEIAALSAQGSMTAFSPDGSRLARRRDGDIVIVDTTDWEPLAVLDHPGSSSGDLGPTGLAWSSDGERIVTSFSGGEPMVGPGAVLLWDAVTGRLEATLSRAWQPQGDVAFSANDRVAAAICQRSATDDTFEQAARVWHAGSGEELFAVPLEDCADAVDLDPEGRLLVVQVEGREEAQVWDIDRGERIGTVDHNPGSGGAARFSPDGQRLLTAGMDGTARVWDIATFEQLVVLEGHTGSATEAVWGRDGTTIVTGGADGTVRIWDAATGEVRLVLDAHRGAVMGLSINPDETWLATSGADGAVYVWALALDDLIDLAGARLSRTLTDAECVTYHVEPCSAAS
ncbi:MAG: BTAD domain-containing putative transcriptional regulator [Ilumatobacter sp.]|uniref:nSTAND1 domain-containing NTPase n=1 Tax=Ilumatobacter sp. TaxID=1967498 RepID=UPI00261D8218|nr:BTAD domain-containing putative transcriptional regulator [Ilumatobacter sp.]MDJ0769993.1 BTAD domain-containing putative transcriptional regulator [Ilumatobacter sp.]